MNHPHDPRPTSDAPTLPTAPVPSADAPTLPVTTGAGNVTPVPDSDLPTLVAPMADAATLPATTGGGVRTDSADAPTLPTDPAGGATVIEPTPTPGSGSGGYRSGTWQSGSTDGAAATQVTGSFAATGTAGATSLNTQMRRRTRVNGSLPADTQALDVKLQLSRLSVFADMIERATGRLTGKFRKMVEDHGTHGRYVVQRPLAQGGMGAVLEIKDGDFQRRAAMKIILPRYAGTPETLERFLAEAQVTAQLEHPNIVPIHDLGVMEDGTLYFTMKFVEGTSLGGVVKSLKEGDAKALAHWSLENLLLTFLKVLDGVGFANSKGVIHRDLKPDNIMLGAHGEVLVVDWGIAKVMGSADPSSDLVKQVQSVRDQDNLSATLSGHAIGTVYYMPPEQADGRLDDIDARSDVYALGATLYELVTLKRPVESGPLARMVEAVTNGRIIPIETAKPDLPPDLAAIIMRAMAWSREARYQDCGAFADDLKRFLAGQAVAARQRNLIERLGAWYQAHRTQVLAGAAGVALLVGGAVGTALYVSHANAAQAAALESEARTLLTAGNLDAALDKVAGSLTRLPDNPEAVALQGEIRAKQGAARERQAAEDRRRAASAKAMELLIVAKASDAAGADPTETDKTLTSAYALAPLPEIDDFRRGILAKLNDRLAQERAARAVAHKAEADRLLDAAASREPGDATVDRLLTDADHALKTAVADGVSPAGFDAAQARLIGLRRSVNERRQAIADRQAADQSIATARAALAAGRLDDAAAAIGAARARLPGDAAIDTLRQDILQAQADAARAALRAANRTRAAAAFTTAVVKNRERQDAIAEMTRQQTAVATLERSLDRDRSALTAARTGLTGATRRVVEAWAQVEQSCATAVNALDDDREYALPDGTVVWPAARRILADVYWVRLQAAQANGSAAEIAAFTNLLSRVDDGTYRERLTGAAQVAISGSGRATWQRLTATADGRFAPEGTAETIALPLAARSTTPGRYLLTQGDFSAAVLVEANATRTVTMPPAPPALAGHALRSVLAPPDGTAFALGTVEITQRQYHAFITDPAVWPRVQAAWTASVRDPATDLVLLPRRSPSPDGATWQVFAVGDDHAVLERVTLPDALADLPVTGISRDDAEAYCAWLAKRSGVAVRLPTRREWQWAATGGDRQRVFPWGTLFDPAFTVSALGFPPDQADVQKPGSRPDDRGPFGHLDLGGNVREWLSDRPDAQDRTAWFGALMAGGGWHDAQPDQFRATFVESAAPNLPNGEIGFRILAPLP